MKPQEQIAQLEKEKSVLLEQVAGLKKRVEELEAAKPKSKSREQAEKGLEMLKKGPVSLAQFATLNPKYPGDVAYYIRNAMKLDLKTVRVAGRGTVYMLPEQFAVYQDGLQKEKEQKQASESGVKELLRQTQIAPSPAAGAVVAAAL